MNRFAPETIIHPGETPEDDQALLSGIHLLAQVVGQDIVQFGRDARDRITVCSTPYVPHQVGAHIEYGRLLGGENQRGQLVAAHQ